MDLTGISAYRVAVVGEFIQVAIWSQSNEPLQGNITRLSSFELYQGEVGSWEETLREPSPAQS
jgi:hypothetical protein